MKTAEEMVKYCDDNRFTYSLKLAADHFSVTERFLDMDENVLLAFVSDNIHHRDYNDLRGAVGVAFTNKRCIITKKNNVTWDFAKAIRYGHINSISSVDTAIIIDTLESHITFKFLCIVQKSWRVKYKKSLKNTVA